MTFKNMILKIVFHIVKLQLKFHWNRFTQHARRYLNIALRYSAWKFCYCIPETDVLTTKASSNLFYLTFIHAKIELLSDKQALNFKYYE